MNSFSGEEAITSFLREALTDAAHVVGCSLFTEYQVPWLRAVLVEGFAGCSDAKVIFPETVKSMGERLFPSESNVAATFRQCDMPHSWLLIGEMLVCVGTVPEPWVQVIHDEGMAQAYRGYFWRYWNYGEAPGLVSSVLHRFSYSSSIDVCKIQSVDQQIDTVVHAIEQEEDGWILDEKTGKKDQRKYWSVPKTTAEFLRLFTRATERRVILEIGTSAGYSTLHFAQALVDTSGEITTIERLPRKVMLAQKHFEQAGVNSFVTLLEGAGLEVVPTLTGQYDLIFLDADREKYEEYLELLLPRLVPGGFIIVDNVFDYGHQMAGYLARVQNDPRLETMIVPVDNGLAITRLR
jgi:predicted O-methyltransferase YrrM